jgi:hypothetical protein
MKWLRRRLHQRRVEYQILYRSRPFDRWIHLFQCQEPVAEAGMLAGCLNLVCFGRFCAAKLLVCFDHREALQELLGASINFRLDL